MTVRQVLPLAEGVEKLGANEKQATFGQAALIFGHNDSMGCRVLNHCFKFFGPSEFFNTLSQKQTWISPSGLARVPCES